MLVGPAYTHSKCFPASIPTWWFCLHLRWQPHFWLLLSQNENVSSDNKRHSTTCRKQLQLPEAQQSTPLTRIEQDDGLKAHKFLPLKVHHTKPSSSSQQHVKDFHHALYTFPLIPVWIPKGEIFTASTWLQHELFIPLDHSSPMWFHQFTS